MFGLVSTINRHSKWLYHVPADGSSSTAVSACVAVEHIMSRLKFRFPKSVSAVAFSLAVSDSQTCAEDLEVVSSSPRAAVANAEFADVIAACNATGTCITRYYLRSATDADTPPVTESAEEITQTTTLAVPGDLIDGNEKNTEPIPSTPSATKPNLALDGANAE